MGYIIQLRLAGIMRAGVVLAMGMLAAQAGAVEVKVGYVNVRKVMEIAPQTDEARNGIEREFAPMERELLQMQKDVRALEVRLAKNEAVLSEAERQRQAAGIRASMRELGRAEGEYRDDLKFRQTQELSRIQQKVTEVIRTLGKAEKYDLILTAGVTYHSDRMDITDKILERLRADFKNSSQ